MPVDGEKGVMVFMNVLNIEHVSKIFGDKKIFDDISYGIHDGDKIGIIGINGTGKSTLLKIIAGEEETDEGQVISQNGLRITYLPQMPDFPKGAIVQDYVADGKWQKDWSTESEARNILNKLGITEHDVPVEQLSGGQKKRVALARTLVNPSDVLILDEPTNHLDNEMVTWLEDYLNRFKGVVIMVTHDRYFLDKVTNKILEISHGKVYSYDANYSGFLELKAQREEMELASERKRQSILRMELEWAKRGCRARTETEQENALLVAGLIGAFYYPTHYTGAIGCQAEIGVAVSMASAALCSMMTDDPDTIHCAASLGGQVLMGLLCNPIEGYVQVPCIVRNMTAVPTAVTCANAALAGMDHIVPLDDVVALMLAVGEKIRPCDEAGTYILKKEEE